MLHKCHMSQISGLEVKVTTRQDTPRPGDMGAVGYQHAGPTAARILLGAQLRRLREEAGVSREDAAGSIRASASKMSRLELGRTGSKTRDIGDLLTLYRLSGGAERATLLALAEEANRPAWWHAYGDLVPAWYEPCLGLEQAASLIRTYEVQFVPGLLQTPGYARAVIRLSHETASDEELDRRVSLRMERQRMERQRILRQDQPRPPRLWAVIDEAALRRPVGGAAIMRAQIQHLIDVADNAEPGHVTIQVMPFRLGGHAAAGGPVTFLRFAQDGLPDFVYLEQLDSALSTTRPADTVHYWSVLNRLATEAEPPASSRTMLRRVLAET
jgi:transcriptional regulator with XRE-family HTH domain